MSTAFSSFAGATHAPSHRAGHSELTFGANVLSLQARRDLRRTVVPGDGEELHIESHSDTRRLKLLLDLAAQAVSTQELCALVRAIMMRIKSATDSDGVCILLQRQQEGELDLYSLDFRSAVSNQQGTVVPFDGTIASYVVRTGKFWSGTREQASKSFQSDLLLKEQFSTGCMVPLSGLNRVVGTLALIRAAHNPYRQDEIDFLTGVSNQIALAVENALAYR